MTTRTTYIACASLGLSVLFLFLQPTQQNDDPAPWKTSQTTGASFVISPDVTLTIETRPRENTNQFHADTLKNFLPSPQQ